MNHLWYVTYEGQEPEPKVEFSIQYVDITPDDLFPLNPDFFNRLRTKIKTQSHYKLVGNIKEIKNPKCEDWSGKMVWGLKGLYSIDTVQNFEFGILIHQITEGNNKLLGLFPPNIFDFPVVRNEIICEFISAFTEEPSRWFGVHVITSKPL